MEREKYAQYDLLPYLLSMVNNCLIEYNFIYRCPTFHKLILLFFISVFFIVKLYLLNKKKVILINLGRSRIEQIITDYVLRLRYE